MFDGTLEADSIKATFTIGRITCVHSRGHRGASEYAKLEKVFVPGLLDEISAWLAARTKK